MKWSSVMSRMRPHPSKIFFHTGSLPMDTFFKTLLKENGPLKGCTVINFPLILESCAVTDAFEVRNRRKRQKDLALKYIFK